MHPSIHIPLHDRILSILPLTLSRAIRFRHRNGRWPQLRSPRAFSDKVNWRILNDDRDLFDWACDKLVSKEVAKQRAPSVLLPTVLWSGIDPSELDGMTIEGRWILKSNNTSEHVLTGEGQPDVAEIARRTARWQDGLQWPVLGERGYRNSRALMVMERWIGDTDRPPTDFKLLVFDGVVHFVRIHTNRLQGAIGHQASLYTTDWKRVDARQDRIAAHEVDLPKPEHLEEMIAIAEQLAAGLDFVRVDLLDTHEGVYFGEVTPYPWSGLSLWVPDSFENKLGSLWTLPQDDSTTHRR